MTTQPPAEIASILNPLLASVQAVNTDGALSHYPGSPLVARHLLRRQDRLTAIELHPDDAAVLKALFAGDIQARVIELDGWLALGAHVPPKEKRGLVLVDPPFEREGEFGRLADGLAKAHRRWPGGIYALWYPIKDRKAVGAFRDSLKNSGIPDIIDLRFEIRAPSPEPRLDGCGMIVVNPPFTLQAEIRAVLPWLAGLLAQGDAPSWAVERLTRERAAS
jgi:23S rRNA (adenine2030-N6)-methyltransferase